MKLLTFLLAFFVFSGSLSLVGCSESQASETQSCQCGEGCECGPECECQKHHCKMELVATEAKLYPGTVCPKGMEMQGWRHGYMGYQAQCFKHELKSVCPTPH